MTHTRYTLGNSAMLVMGTLLAIFNSFMTSMTFAFGDLRGNAFQRFCIQLYALGSFLSLPVFIIMFRWSGIGCISAWCLTLLCAILALLGGEFETLFTFILIQLVLSLFTSGIDSTSKGLAPQSANEN